MRIRRFRAPDVTTAMAMVKRALGPEAVILSRRDLRGSGAQERIEIIAAADPHSGEDESDAVVYSTRDGMAGQVASDRTSRVLADLASEVCELRRSLRHLAGGNRRRTVARLGMQWLEPYDRLCARGVLPHVAFDLVARSALESRSKELPAEEGIAGVIESTLVAGGALSRVTFAVGPTGSGKTTTVAKLAAQVAATGSVGLVMADGFRLGATEQLGGFARVLGVPIEVATDGQELERALGRFSDKKHILVDTSGQSGGEPERVALEELVRVVPKPERRIALVVSATTETRALDRAWRWLSGLRPELCIATKLDEAGGLAQVYNWLWETRVPLSHLATGQRVPDDLERATGVSVGSWLLGGAGSRVSTA